MLIAHGLEPRQRLKQSLESGRCYIVGRDAGTDLPIPWDGHISRRHIRLQVEADGVEIERLPEARNPLFFDGNSVDRIRAVGGEHFVIGTTTFQILGTRNVQSSPSETPVEEVTFERHELHKVRIRDADKRIDVLARLGEVIRGSRVESDLYHHLTSLVLSGVPHAEAVAVVSLAERGRVEILHWDRRRETAGEFRPSAKLVRDAADRRRSVLHVWESAGAQRVDYTAVAEFDWAYCTPILDAPTPTWALYVAGRLDYSATPGSLPAASGSHLHADVKFTEIVAEIISSVRRSNKLERQKSALRQFFAPPILAALGDDLDTDLLEPRECDVTVLFCDLRGFSKRSEESAGDLIGLLDRVSRALEVMTHHILKHGGVTGDFQGDAALGFWGWPFASDESPLNACRAALGIREEFAGNVGRPEHPLANFQMGIGIAKGRAVAGKIGTSEQVKVTVFGPVVNLASRLESMTKQLRVPIVLDEATASVVGRNLPAREGRLRKLAKILPFGLETPLVVSELLPPVEHYPDLSDAHIRQFEEGVQQFIAGRWEDAYRALHGMPASDRAQDFLGMYIAQHNRVAPSDWDGVIRLPSK